MAVPTTLDNPTKGLMSNNNIYCVYLTSYKGSKLPPFYIGSSSINKIHNGYRGSVASKLYGKIWKSELKLNPELFCTRIIATYSTRKDATLKELKFQTKLKVTQSSMYINRALAKPNGFHGTDVSKEKHPRWNTKHTIEAKDKISKANSGKIPHNKNVPMAESMKLRISNTKKTNPKPAWNKGKIMNYSDQAKINQSRAKTWLIITPDGDELTIKNLRKFCKEYSLSERRMRASKTCNNWRCMLLH